MMAEHNKIFLNFWVVRPEQLHTGVCMETQIMRETLHNKREYEHYRKATSEYIELLLKTVERSPSDLGYEFGRWTAERLATYLTEKTGIDLSSSQVRRILKRKKYSYIWAKYDLEFKQDPIERALFQERLSRYARSSERLPRAITSLVLG